MSGYKTSKEFKRVTEERSEVTRRAESDQDHRRSEKIKLLFLIGCLLLTGVATWVVVHGIKQEIFIPASNMVKEKGKCYTTHLPESPYWPFENVVDGLQAPDQSKTVLFEDGKPLGPAHSLHEAISSTGAGRFLHWGSTLYFSSFDNSDPRANGRRYRVAITATMPTWILAVVLPCLLFSCYLNRHYVSLAVKQIKLSGVTSLAIKQSTASLAVKQSEPSATESRKIRWRWGVLAALAMTLLSLYPQIDLWLTRGADWHGSYASLNYDEEIYATYINGLILGRPRRAQPLEITDPSKPSYESFFSIQIVPAYLIAAFTRVSGLTVAQAFILLTPLIAFLTTLMLFSLLVLLTRDEAIAAVSALAVLIFGTLVARHSAINQFFGLNWYGTFMFLRRYEPAALFPALFAFMALIWQALTGEGRRAWSAAIAAGAVFAVLVFSYFFLWTAAAAWLACLVLVWFAARPTEWPRLVKRLTPTALFAALVFPVYASMIMHRDPVMDTKSALLEFTHAPDFHRAPEWLGVVTLLLLFWAVKKKRVSWREPVVLLASSLALMPFVAFNQQILTGHSLEPVHYEMFAANYLALLAFILVLVTLWQGRSLYLTLTVLWRQRNLHFDDCVQGWLMAVLACVVIGWGLFEMNNTTSLHKERNVARDLFMPVAKRLTALASEHGKSINSREVVFSPDMLVISDNVSAAAPQTPFWATHVPGAAGLSWDEQQERYFQYLYYSGMQPGSLFLAFKNNDMHAVGAAFGHERYNPNLTADFKPITAKEIEDKVRQYREYVATFNAARARHPEISYVIVETKSPFDFTNLDRWYIRDAGEQIGPFRLYQLRLRGLAPSDSLN